MLEGLANANGESNRHHDRGRGGGAHRNKGKGDAPSLPRTLQLDLDCTDVYGRLERRGCR